jgi:hypothetical protein
MASWIIHLRIAEEFLALTPMPGAFPGLDAEKFALGSVAPDSGKPDEKWENFTPSTLVTHFEQADSRHHDCADLEFFRRYLLPLRGGSDPLVFSLRLGYFFHLVTDNLWGGKIGRPTQEKYQEQFSADRDFIWEVKKDWYGLDFIYVRDHPDCLFWRVFRTARPDTGGLEFLVPESLAWSVDHIQQYYQRTDKDIQALYNRPYVYLSCAQADRFVDESTRQLYRIFEHLWINGTIAGEAASALDLNI